MASFESLFPTFLQKCVELHELLRITTAKVGADIPEPLVELFESGPARRARGQVRVASTGGPEPGDLRFVEMPRREAFKK